LEIRQVAAREFEERNQKATASVASIVGITIASMMPVALNMMSRWAEAMGPFGSRTPSEQPPASWLRAKQGAAQPIAYEISAASGSLELRAGCRLGVVRFVTTRWEPPRSSIPVDLIAHISFAPKIRIFNKRKP
jgi:hypothetical protein